MKFKKGSKAAKDYMASIRAKKGTAKKTVAKKTSAKHKDTKSHNVNIKVVSGWKKGNTQFVEKGEPTSKTKKNILVTRRKLNDPKGTFFAFKKLGAIVAGFFDTKAINDLDALKQEYRKLAVKYHPDKGGNTAQFQALVNEYEKLRDKILSGSKLSDADQKNEIVIDEALRAAINAIIGLDGINIELIGKWIWVSGNTYPLRTIFSAAGFKYIKKSGVSYWVYKGVESSSRGGTDMQDIVKKYGSTPIKPSGPSGKKLSGVKTSLTVTQKSKFKTALLKLKRAINKRAI